MSCSFDYTLFCGSVVLLLTVSTQLFVKLKRLLAMSMAVVTGLAAFSACGQQAPSNEAVPADFSPRGYSRQETADDAASYWQGLLSQLTLEEKIGQLFIIRPDQVDLSFEPSSQHSHYSHARTLSAPMQEALKKATTPIVKELAKSALQKACPSIYHAFIPPMVTDEI